MGVDEGSCPSGSAEADAATRWLGLAALVLVSFLLTLDDTALSVALPSVGRDLGLATLLPGLMLAGFGIGLTTAPVTAAALDDAPLDEAGVRAGILNTSRMIGLAVGIALMGAIVTARWPGGLAGAATDPQAFVDGLSIAFLVNAAIALVGATVATTTIAGGRAAGEGRASGDAPVPADGRRTAASATAPAS
ncbi:hypothetical protein Gocc_0659 [Gaiella occulta]|uniref:Major Facilitator Superfamily n=1 Tax=Gaiella occulta TaxID=1002870 RepID=A0A7M2Z1Q6_9ACTN|nr:hypothetical protein [Gaiella occulta]RDI76240.1 hypothetical protein Gocc_0659 [Gaiella occulta]